jgi:hypothetical protein
MKITSLLKVIKFNKFLLIVFSVRMTVFPVQLFYNNEIKIDFQNNKNNK